MCLIAAVYWIKPREILLQLTRTQMLFIDADPMETQVPPFVLWASHWTPDRRGRGTVFLQDCLQSHPECAVEVQTGSDLGIGETEEYIWHNPDVRESLLKLLTTGLDPMIPMRWWSYVRLCQVGHVNIFVGPGKTFKPSRLLGYIYGLWLGFIGMFFP